MRQRRICSDRCHGAMVALLCAAMLSIAACSAGREPAAQTARPARTAVAPASELADQSRHAAGGLYATSAEAFFSRADVQQPIDFDNIDAALLRAAVFHATNQRRAQEGLPELDHLARLDEAAESHLVHLAQRGVLSHQSRLPDRRRPIDRVRAAGLHAAFVAENLATHYGIQYESGRTVYILDERDEHGRQRFSYSPDGPPIEPHSYGSFAQRLLDQWMASPGHRGNIVATEPTHLGCANVPTSSDLGMIKFYCAQLFFSELR